MLRMSVLFGDIQINQHDRTQCYHLGAMVEVSGIFMVYRARPPISLSSRYIHVSIEILLSLRHTVYSREKTTFLSSI